MNESESDVATEDAILDEYLYMTSEGVWIIPTYTPEYHFTMASGIQALDETVVISIALEGILYGEYRNWNDSFNIN